jgi:hypothetical protein
MLPEARTTARPARLPLQLLVEGLVDATLGKRLADLQAALGGVRLALPRVPLAVPWTRG